MTWEVSLLQFLESLRGTSLNSVFQIITFAGEGVLLIGIIAIVYWCINKEMGLKLGFIMLFSMLGNGFIKNSVKAQRPFELGIVEGLRRHTATGYSFPSGHTQSATTFWLALMLDMKERWVHYVGGVMIGLIALSRLYLGVHWPVDVLAAIFLGIVCTMIGQYVFEKFRKLSMLVLVSTSIIVGSTLLLGFDRDYTKALGAMIGLIVGLVLELRYISFDTKGSAKIQVLKVVVGIAGLIAVAGGLKIMFPQGMIFDLLRYMAIVAWIIAGAPYMFKKIIIKRLKIFVE